MNFERKVHLFFLKYFIPIMIIFFFVQEYIILMDSIAFGHVSMKLSMQFQRVEIPNCLRYIFLTACHFFFFNRGMPIFLVCDFYFFRQEIFILKNVKSSFQIQSHRNEPIQKQSTLEKINVNLSYTKILLIMIFDIYYLVSYICLISNHFKLNINFKLILPLGY